MVISLFQKAERHTIFVAINNIMMIRQFTHKFFHTKERIITGILSDIEIIYNHIQQNGEIYNEWYFQHVFTTSYWKYLNYYSWLSPKKQDFLIQGCLNIILFLSYQYIDGKGTFLKKYFQEINRAVDTFSPIFENHKQLYYMVKEALILADKKRNGIKYDEKRNNIYQSISWTLKNTILNSNPSYLINYE